MNQSSRVLYLSLLLKVQCCIVYVINLLEFYLVRGIACLLIPFFFIDATKSYAENIIKILLTYFFKILITVFICYFALGLFLDVVTQTVATADTNSSLTLITYLFTIFMGVMFCGKVPEILSVVMSGNPSMGFGTILQSARGAIHTASHLGGAAKVVKDASNAVKGAVQGGIGMGMGAVSAQLKDSLKQRFQDGIFKHGTGQNVVRDKSDGHALTLGQQFYDEDGRLQTATVEDVKKSHQNRANDIIGQTSQLLKDGFDEHDDLVNKGILPANEAFDFLDDLGFK